MTPTAKILVVDDDPGIRFFLEELLERDGHEVVCVESGERALRRIAAEEFDLALIDLKLQGISGTEVLKHLHERWPDTVIIMLTGHGSLESAVEALRQGAHDYLFKPCKTLELRESIRAGLLNRQQKKNQRFLLQQVEQYLANSLENVRATMGKDAAPLTSQLPPMPALSTALPPTTSGEQARFLQRGGLIVDSARHVITMDGQILELSPTEFDVLAYLVSEAPRVVEPQELIREVQGYASEVWEARDTIRYHIYRIRQKIKEATGRTGVVQNVRGIGYTIQSLPEEQKSDE